MRQSLDEVLADVDSSEQEIVTEETGTEQVSQETEQDQQEEAQEPDAHGALHAERNRVRRKYTDTVADFEKRLNETNSGFEKKLTESLAENDRKWEQRFNQFATQIQPRREPEVEAPARPDMFENPDGFVDHGVRQVVDPIQKEVGQLREFYSQREAVRDHGKETVETAFQSLHQAALSGDPDARATVERVKKSMDPFGDIVSWHKKSSVIREVGNDPNAFIQRKLEEALNDPTFLAKAAEKLSGKKPAASASGAASQTLPSVNRVTAAADEDEEIENPGEVFNTALRRGVRR
jgi:hypothetical protein